MSQGGVEGAGDVSLNGHTPPVDIRSYDFKVPADSGIVAALVADELELPDLTDPLEVLLKGTARLPSLAGMVVGAVKDRIPVLEVGYVGDIGSWNHWMTRGPKVPTYMTEMNNIWRAVSLRLMTVPSLERLSMMPLFFTEDPTLKDPTQQGMGRFIKLDAVARAHRQGEPINQPGIIDPDLAEHLQRYTFMAIMQK